MSMIDVSTEDFVTLDKKTVSIPFLRSILPLFGSSCNLIVESAAPSSPSSQTIKILHDGAAITHTFTPRLVGSPGRPVEVLTFAEMVSADGTSRIVDRDSPEHDALIEAGWAETGKTRPRSPRTLKGAVR